MREFGKVWAVRCWHSHLFVLFVICSGHHGDKRWLHQRHFWQISAVQVPHGSYSVFTWFHHKVGCTCAVKKPNTVCSPLFTVCPVPPDAAVAFSTDLGMQVPRSALVVSTAKQTVCLWDEHCAVHARGRHKIEHPSCSHPTAAAYDCRA